MDCNCIIIIAFLLSVIEASDLSDKQWNRLKRPKRDYKIFDHIGRPVWDSIVQNSPAPLENHPTTNAPVQSPTAKTEKYRIIYESTSEEMEENPYPCSKELPPKKKDFAAPGKRKALEKCDEYKEEGRYIMLQDKKEQDCFNALNKRFLSLNPTSVINGNVTIPGQFPHMGALGWKTTSNKYDFRCGGSLISSNFVLTAAHCTMDRTDSNLQDPKPTIVRFGDIFVRDERFTHLNRIDIPISDIIKHKEHKTPSKYNDIALLKLEEDVTFNSYVRPACLWHQSDTAALGRRANVTGWGEMVSSTSSTLSPNLLYAELDIVNNDICNEKLRGLISTRILNHGVQNTQMCAGNPSGGVDTCQGDSGGPLQVVKKENEVSVHYVIGVTSFGVACAVPDIPGIYTRVSAYLDWIESCVWDDIHSPICEQNSKIL